MYVQSLNGTTAVEYTRAQLKADHPTVSFPRNPSDELLADYSVYPVITTPQPDIDPATQKITGYTLEGSGATWTQTWQVVPMTQEEQAAYQLDQNWREDSQAIKTDAQVKALLVARPDQINNYIENNVTDMAGAKEVLKILARALAVVAHQAIRD